MDIQLDRIQALICSLYATVNLQKHRYCDSFFGHYVHVFYVFLYSRDIDIEKLLKLITFRKPLFSLHDVIILNEKVK